ncbi:hypothetical protein JCM5353_008705 [Sporobolomyces roseus]
MVDRFSSLPNELLDLIFEYTYSSHAPSRPLSKRFLPFYRIHLYRSIHLSSPQHLESLLETVQSQNTLGTLVLSLCLPISKSTASSNPKPTKTLKKLLPLLPNLDQLDATVFDRFGAVVRSIGNLEPLASTLTSLAVSAPETSDEGFLKLHKLYDLLSHLRSLVTLQVYQWEIYDDFDLTPKDGTVLPTIKTLEIHGRGAEDDSAAELVSTFPMVANLTLHSTYMDDSSWSIVLPGIPATLESLSLFADHVHFGPVDSFSTALHTLRRIHLGRNCFTPSIHHRLQKLSRLEEIHLGNGLIDAKAFLSLVTGPFRFVHLRHLILDLEGGHFGLCISMGGSEVMVEENEDCVTDWELPEWFEDRFIDRNDMEHLIESARSSGILVEGTVLKALKVLKLFCIDQNNRAILAYSGPADLRRLHNTRMEALRYNYKLPELDFDLLERDKLEIVETKMPGTEWSVFGFRDKEK